MNTIRLSQVLPHVFQNSSFPESDIWNKEVTLKKGKVYLIEASSGTGKSSLCSYLSGYRNDYSGQICFDKLDTHHFGVKEWTDIRSRHISHLFQDLRLFPELTAYENIEIKNKLTHHKSEKQIDEWLDYLGIADKRNTLVGRMSFGQRQRVAMIRALAQPFDFLLADEPISHLDEQNAQRMGEIMMSEIKNQQAGAILTSIGKQMQLPYDNVFHL